ncbi:unnamed protein product [Closterium sp. NIES-64]|nr:unnamed protein product [Closterium sp. NIES-64]
MGEMGDGFQSEYEYTEKDVALYALGVGACSSDACDSIDLPFAYNHLFQDRFFVGTNLPHSTCYSYPPCVTLPASLSFCPHSVSHPIIISQTSSPPLRFSSPPPSSSNYSPSMGSCEWMGCGRAGNRIRSFLPCSSLYTPHPSPPPSLSDSSLLMGSCEWMGQDTSIRVHDAGNCLLSLPLSLLSLYLHSLSPFRVIHLPCIRLRISRPSPSLSSSPPLHSSPPSPSFDPALLLHGEQYLCLFRPLPTSAKAGGESSAHISAEGQGQAAIVDVESPDPSTAPCVVNRARISALKDKGRAAIVDVETVSFDRESGARLAVNRAAIVEAEAVSFDRESGARLAVNRSSIVLRGAGGFSSKLASTPATTPRPSAPTTSTNPSQPQQQPQQPPPARGSASVARQPSVRPAPHASAEERIPPNQALLYRLCGDLNPLHSDPEFAATAGYPRPILHGLCTLGFATRAILRTCCRGDPSLFHSVQVRFTGHVFPGETLITRTWQPVSIPASSAAGEDEPAGSGEGGVGAWGRPLMRVSFECWIAERNRMVLSGWMQLCADSEGTDNEFTGRDVTGGTRLAKPRL